jgi:hypothetical protein
VCEAGHPRCQPLEVLAKPVADEPGRFVVHLEQRQRVGATSEDLQLAPALRVLDETPRDISGLVAFLLRVAGEEDPGRQRALDAAGLSGKLNDMRVALKQTSVLTFQWCVIVPDVARLAP